jgi:hypothetical protein
MGFLSRKKSGAESEAEVQDRAEVETRAQQLEQETGQNVSVMPLGEMEEHAARVAETIATRYTQELPEPVQLALHICARTIFGTERAEGFSSEVYRWATSMGRVGYLTRVFEEEKLGADPNVPAVAKALEVVHAKGFDWWATVNALAGEMAAEVDDPMQVTWNVPGPGGDFRSQIARVLLEGMLADTAPPKDMDPADFPRCWLFGFMFRCGEKSLPSGVTI